MNEQVCSVYILFQEWGNLKNLNGTSLVKNSLLMQEMQVQSLVKEQKSHMSQDN